MRPSVKFIAKALATTVLAGSIVAGSGSPASTQSFEAADEARVHGLVNSKRQSMGLQPLSSHAGLVSMARNQAVRMLQAGKIYHNPSLGAEITGLGLLWQLVGENVGVGPNVDIVQDAFLASPGHYENIVKARYNTVGIGVVRKPDGGIYITQVFADLAISLAPAPAPAAPAPAPAAPEPAPAATATAPAAAPAAPAAAPARAAPQPAPAPPPPPTPDPNAVVGGVVEAELALPELDAEVGGELEAVPGGFWDAIAGVFRQATAIVAFWT